MTTSRRTFLTGAGAIGVWAAGAGIDADAPQPARRTLGTGMAKGMTLLTLRREGRDRLGVKTSRGILDAALAADRLGLYGPATMDDLLQREDGPSLQAVVDAALASDRASAAFFPESAIEYGPLVSRPEKIVCVGLNYRKHAAETGQAVQKWLILFNKFNGSLNRHKGTIALPTSLATQFDYEVELVIVMGRRARAVSEADAHAYVAGYATGNDFTARDLQNGRGGQWMIGKALDQFAPVGPYLVTADQVNPDALAIELRVNGETRQSSNTADMVFGTRQIVSYVSQYFALAPGDLIFAGTPEGVILGKPKDQQVWLKRGDTIACSVEKLGELRFELV